MTQRPPLLEQVERFEQASAELRDAIREAHSATKALNQACKEADAHCRNIIDAASIGVQHRIDEAMKAGLAHYAQDLERAIKEGADRVNKRFDQIANTLMFGNSQGRGDNVFEQIIKKSIVDADTSRRDKSRRRK
jgi:hypothetical protein